LCRRHHLALHRLSIVVKSSPSPAGRGSGPVAKR
jgi:hypothetical protein